MSEHLVTNADDVDIIIEDATGSQVGTPQALGRMVVDDFSITIANDNNPVSGVGFQIPAGVSMGDVTYEWSFTMMGSDTDVFDKLSDSKGRSKTFSMTARHVNDDGNIVWEYALQFCFTNSEEIGATTSDPMEVPVEGGAVRLEKVTN